MNGNGIGPRATAEQPVMQDVQREYYNLDHFSYKCGAIGALQTLSMIPIVAGDSIALRGNFLFRLNPLRQYQYIDARVDLDVYFVPNRHVYASNAAGSRWEDWMKAGTDEAITLGSTTLAAIASNNYNCFGFFYQGGASGQTVPKYAIYPYMQIFRNYYKDPSDTTAYADTYFESGIGSPTANEANFGLKCCHLKRIWNTAVLTTVSSADYSLPLSGGEVNLYEFSQLQGRLKTETERDWYAIRYRDIMEMWGSKISIDAEQRPEHVMHSSAWLSGRDVEGTDDATLGSYAGKGAGLFNISFPSKFFPEHGTLWVMALVRFPAIPFNEWNYLLSKPEPTYKALAGDPDIIRREPPVDLNLNEICQSGPNVVVGKIPYAQWYREQPSVLHEFFQIVAGHPFININSVSTRNGAIYIDHDAYNDVFKSSQFKHWTSSGYIEVDAKRFIPPVTDSIFAGTN